MDQKYQQQKLRCHLDQLETFDTLDLGQSVSRSPFRVFVDQLQFYLQFTLLAPRNNADIHHFMLHANRFHFCVMTSIMQPIISEDLLYK
jgi:hypothetical protein